MNHAAAGVQGIGRIDMVEDRLVGNQVAKFMRPPGVIALIDSSLRPRHP